MIAAQHTLLHPFRGMKFTDKFDYTNAQILAALFAMYNAVSKSPPEIWCIKPIPGALHHVIAYNICGTVTGGNGHRVFVHSCNLADRYLKIEHVPLVLGFKDWNLLETYFYRDITVDDTLSVKRPLMQLIDQHMNHRLHLGAEVTQRRQYRRNNPNS